MGGIDLSAISLAEAVDALLQDYFAKLTLVGRAYGKGKGKQLDELTEEALDRRSLVALLDGSGLDEDSVAESSRQGRERAERQAGVVAGGFDCHNIRDVFDLEREEIDRWSDWIPGVGQQILVYLSAERGCWPGVIIPLNYFDQACLPNISTRSIYAVRIYPSKQAPTLTIKSHMIPLHYRPDTPPNASPTHNRAYETAQESEIYDMEAKALEGSMRHAWGQDPRRLDESGRSWKDKLTWLESEVRQEVLTTAPNGESVNGMTVEEREEAMDQAKGILAEIWKGQMPGSLAGRGPVQSQCTSPIGTAVNEDHGLAARGYEGFSRDTCASPAEMNASWMIPRSRSKFEASARQIANGKSTTEMPGLAETAPGKPTHGRMTYRRSRRNFASMLADPLIGPVLNKMDLAELQAALITPLNVSTRDTSLLVPVTSEPGPFSYIPVRSKRKRGGDDGVHAQEQLETASQAVEFVSPMSGRALGGGMRVEAQLREDDEMDMDFDGGDRDAGWRSYAPRKLRRIQREPQPQAES